MDGASSVNPITSEADNDPFKDRLTDGLLQGTSRTFALAIPLLAIERRRQIGLAYLLFRVADSIEDAPDADVASRIRLLTTFLNAADVAGSCSASPVSDAEIAELAGLWPSESAISELLLHTPSLIAMLKATSPSAADIICKALNRTVVGMTQFLEASQISSRQIQIQSVRELQLYCYVVAGIVGEMLTDLFLSQQSVPQSSQSGLQDLSRGFGEFLQLINILKDVDTDALGGRFFIPNGISRDSVLALALSAAKDADRYICILEENQFPADVVSFCRFLYLLGVGTLNCLKPGTQENKLSREEVMRLLHFSAESHQTVVL